VLDESELETESLLDEDELDEESLGRFQWTQRFGLSPI